MLTEGLTSRLPLYLLLAVSGAAPLSAAAHFETAILDSLGSGFADTSAWTPSGGNPATTLGEARLKALEFALSIWSETLDSDVPIRVGARFESMGGSGTDGTMGSGGAARWFKDFAGAPRANTWYPAALADKLAGSDLDPGVVDLNLVFNSDVDGPNVLGSHGFDYSLTLDPAEGDVSFVLVALHEIAHGLGVTLSIDPVTGAKREGADDPYLIHLVRAGATPENLADMTDAQRLGALVSGAELQWDGPAVAAASAELTGGTASGGRVLMDAPTSYDPKENGVHFAVEVAPDEIQEPSYTGNQLHMALTRALLEDLGWGPAPGCQAAGAP
jgi:hypothetical protein